MQTVEEVSLTADAEQCLTSRLASVDSACVSAIDSTRCQCPKLCVTLGVNERSLVSTPVLTVSVWSSACSENFSSTGSPIGMS